MLKRLMSAAVLIAMVGGALTYLSTNILIGLLLLLMLGLNWEWTRLSGLKKPRARLVFTLGLFALEVLLATLLKSFIVLVASVLWLGLAGMVIRYPRYQFKLARPEWGLGLGGIVLAAFMWSIVFLLNKGVYPFFLFGLLFIVYLNDSVAYFVGRGLGKSRLLPAVSPNKTWAGFWGGMLVNLSVGIIASLKGLWPFSWWAGSIIMLVTTLYAVLGDLFESVLKRNQNLKDSGHLIPGHGGLLDRLDSLIAAAPIYILLLFVLPV